MEQNKYTPGLLTGYEFGPFTLENTGAAAKVTGIIR